MEVRLPGLSIGIDDVRTVFRRRAKTSGSCLIINGSCGLALDTAFGTELGAVALMWPPHGHQQQLWELRPSGIAGEVLIISVANGLALDATTPMTGDIKSVMWKPTANLGNGGVWRTAPTASVISFVPPTTAAT